MQLQLNTAYVIKVEKIFWLCHLGPAVVLHCLSVPSVADEKRRAGQGRTETDGNAPPGGGDLHQPTVFSPIRWL